MTEPQQPKDYATDERHETARHVVSSMTPPERGWILAFVSIFIVLMAANLWSDMQSSERLVAYIESSQSLDELTEKNRAEDMRRCMEVISDTNKVLLQRQPAGETR